MLDVPNEGHHKCVRSATQLSYNDLYSESLRIAELKKEITDVKRIFGPKSDKRNEGTVKYLYTTMNSIQRVEAVSTVSGQASKEFELPQYEDEEAGIYPEDAAIIELPPLHSRDGQDIGATLSVVEYKRTPVTDELSLEVRTATEGLPFYAMVTIDFVDRTFSDDEEESYWTDTIFQKIQLMDGKLSNCPRYLDYDEQKDRRRGDDENNAFRLSAEMIPLGIGYDGIRERLLTILTLETEIKREELVHLLNQPEHFEE